jgi:hypothetical protein
MRGKSGLAWSAGLGAGLWSLLVVLNHARAFAIGEIAFLFMLAPLVITPLGLLLLSSFLGRVQRDSTFELACRLQPVGALFAVGSFFLAPGMMAGGLAAGWFVICLLLAASGLRGILNGQVRHLPGACTIVSLLYLPVGGAWLLASRLGLSPMGFTEPIVLLTAVHFHYAGFAAPLLAVATARTLTASDHWKYAAFKSFVFGVLGGPALLAAGFIVGPKVKPAAAIVVALSEAGLALAMLAAVRSIQNGATRVLLVASSASALFGMALAGRWALGEYPRQPFLDLARMARLHGVTNAIGFVLCGLLGWVKAFRAWQDGAELPQ